jgi:hypothetical protein
MRFALLTLLLLTAHLVRAGEAEIFHCQDDRGRMAFSDRPCPDELEFIGMRTMRTYGSPSNIAQAETTGGEAQKARKQRPASERGVVVTASPVPEKDCEPREDSPWLNTLGEDDC